MLTLQMKKLRHRKLKRVARSLTVGNQRVSPVLSDLRTHAINYHTILPPQFNPLAIVSPQTLILAFRLPEGRGI